MLLVAVSNTNLTAYFRADTPFDIIYAFYLHEKKHLREIRMEENFISFSVANPNLIELVAGADYEILVKSGNLLMINHYYIDRSWTAPQTLLEKYNIEVELSSEEQEPPQPEGDLYSVTPSWIETPEQSYHIPEDSDEEKKLEEEGQDIHYKRYMYT